MFDLTKIATLVAGLGDALRVSRDAREARVAAALDWLEKAPEPEELADIIKRASSTWQFAYPLEGLQTKKTGPEAPENYTALATDGSQAAPGRHSPLPYYVINTGRVHIRYGEDRAASLDSEPVLGDFSAAEEELSYLGYEVRREVHVSEERIIAELKALAELSAAAEPPAVAMYDGSLILWYLSKKREGLRERVIAGLTKWFDVCRANGIVPVGYISKPGARDVVYDLALLACDLGRRACDRCRKERRRDEVRCSETVKLHDADVFGEVLAPGERSGVFINRSTPILNEYGAEDNRVAYFYLNAGAEVARVEFPRWVFDDGLVDITHTLTFDQCAKGGGYPRAMALAHEYAVVDRNEAEAFLTLLEGAALPLLASPKELAKRRRRV